MSKKGGGRRNRVDELRGLVSSSERVAGGLSGGNVSELQKPTLRRKSSFLQLQSAQQKSPPSKFSISSPEVKISDKKYRNSVEMTLAFIEKSAYGALFSKKEDEGNALYQRTLVSVDIADGDFLSSGLLKRREKRLSQWRASKKDELLMAKQRNKRIDDIVFPESGCDYTDDNPDYQNDLAEVKGVLFAAVDPKNQAEVDLLNNQLDERFNNYVKGLDAIRNNDNLLGANIADDAFYTSMIGLFFSQATDDTVRYSRKWKNDSEYQEFANSLTQAFDEALDKIDATKNIDEILQFLKNRDLKDSVHKDSIKNILKKIAELHDDQAGNLPFVFYRWIIRSEFLLVKAQLNLALSNFNRGDIFVVPSRIKDLVQGNNIAGVRGSKKESVLSRGLKSLRGDYNLAMRDSAIAAASVALLQLDVLGRGEMLKVAMTQPAMREFKSKFGVQFSAGELSRLQLQMAEDLESMIEKNKDPAKKRKGKLVTTADTGSGKSYFVEKVLTKYKEHFNGGIVALDLNSSPEERNAVFGDLTKKYDKSTLIILDEEVFYSRYFLKLFAPDKDDGFGVASAKKTPEQLAKEIEEIEEIANLAVRKLRENGANIFILGASKSIQKVERGEKVRIEQEILYLDSKIAELKSRILEAENGVRAKIKAVEDFDKFIKVFSKKGDKDFAYSDLKDSLFENFAKAFFLESKFNDLKKKGVLNRNEYYSQILSPKIREILDGFKKMDIIKEEKALRILGWLHVNREAGGNAPLVSDGHDAPKAINAIREIILKNKGRLGLGGELKTLFKLAGKGRVEQILQDCGLDKKKVAEETESFSAEEEYEMVKLLRMKDVMDLKLGAREGEVASLKRRMEDTKANVLASDFEVVDNSKWPDGHKTLSQIVSFGNFASKKDEKSRNDNRLQCIMPDFYIDEKSCTLEDFVAIQNSSGADIIVVPHLMSAGVQKINGVDVRATKMGCRVFYKKPIEYTYRQDADGKTVRAKKTQEFALETISMDDFNSQEDGKKGSFKYIARLLSRPLNVISFFCGPDEEHRCGGNVVGGDYQSSIGTTEQHIYLDVRKEHSLGLMKQAYGRNRNSDKKMEVKKKIFAIGDPQANKDKLMQDLQRVEDVFDRADALAYLQLKVKSDPNAANEAERKRKKERNKKMLDDFLGTDTAERRPFSRRKSGEEFGLDLSSSTKLPTIDEGFTPTSSAAASAPSSAVGRRGYGVDGEANSDVEEDLVFDEDAGSLGSSLEDSDKESVVEDKSDLEAETGVETETETRTETRTETEAETETETKGGDGVVDESNDADIDTDTESEGDLGADSMSQEEFDNTLQRALLANAQNALLEKRENQKLIIKKAFDDFRDGKVANEIVIDFSSLEVGKRKIETGDLKVSGEIDGNNPYDYQTMKGWIGLLENDSKYRGLKSQMDKILQKKRRDRLELSSPIDNEEALRNEMKSIEERFGVARPDPRSGKYKQKVYRVSFCDEVVGYFVGEQKIRFVNCEIENGLFRNCAKVEETRGVGPSAAAVGATKGSKVGATHFVGGRGGGMDSDG